MSVIIHLPMCEIGKSDCLLQGYPGLKTAKGIPAFAQPSSASRRLELEDNAVKVGVLDPANTEIKWGESVFKFEILPSGVNVVKHFDK